MSAADHIGPQMRLYHGTDPQSAETIMNTGEFVPSGAHDTLGGTSGVWMTPKASFAATFGKNVIMARPTRPLKVFPHNVDEHPETSELLNKSREWYDRRWMWDDEDNAIQDNEQEPEDLGNYMKSRGYDASRFSTGTIVVHDETALRPSKRITNINSKRIKSNGSAWGIARY